MPSGQQPCEGGDQPGISPFRNRRAGRPRRTGQILITPDGGRAAFQRPRGRRKKQVTPGVQRPGPRPQNGGDGMGNINPEGKTPQGRGSGVMPSVATGTAWENPAQTGVCHRKCWSSNTGNHNPARRGLNQGSFPGKRQHHLPRATGAKPRSRDPCAHTGTAPRRRQGRHPVSHGTMSPDTKDRLSGP